MKQYVTCSVLLIISYLSVGRQCYECNFFKKISVFVTPKSIVPYLKMYTKNNFSGCFEPKNFDVVVYHLSVVDQIIPELGDHAVYDLPQLMELSFTGCNIKNISLRALENLPKLRIIHINHGNLTSISAGIFNDLLNLEDLDLSHNEISYIQIHTFLHMTSLKQVILSSNKLSSIENDWFSDNPNLTLIDLSYNSIKKIDNFTFLSTPNLKDLFLDYNQINHIGKKTFYGLTNMEIVSLRHNRIALLDANIIPNNFQVHMLRLNANFLNFLSHDFLKKIKVNALELTGNPWICPCLNQIEDWMRQWNVTSLNGGYCKRHNIPKCIYDNSDNICLEILSSEITESYLGKLKNLKIPVDDECANLS
ncbi:phospholipase A2 inhibitor beta-like isoform X1 [Harmonia axyridis]|uniref:phospholipase A2 inhibitor beta-like isoform X1 n=1 Tax=Harmonia axyridis TaxID=115357 RepID=UPI001E276CAD|nr:phospholipase A2 inhibitor beta-like isoform X1 [Harmonia axyridis]